MVRAIDLDKAIEIIEEKQKELCPVGSYGRHYVYGSDREKYDAWEEIIDALDALPTLTPPNGWVSVEERLPEPTYCVLVYTTDYSIEVDARGSDGEWMSYEVTHWMPLPVPPDRRPPEGEI